MTVTFTTQMLAWRTRAQRSLRHFGHGRKINANGAWWLAVGAAGLGCVLLSQPRRQMEGPSVVSSVAEPFPPTGISNADPNPLAMKHSSEQSTQGEGTTIQ